ncbi:MAG: N-acetylmuramic acid 6-phosphate etherase [Planctomycetota bacterium]|jgi:N-acetylmuramic acid 6-phosphate etherase
MTLPPDRGHLVTEQRHAASMTLDELSTLDAVNLMIDDHRVVPQAVADAATALAPFIDALVSGLARGGRLVYVGAGTSGRLGVLDAAECPPTFQSPPSQIVGIIAGGDGALRQSSESREDDEDGAAHALAALDLSDRDSLLGIAAGGTTPYVLGAIRIAHAAGATTGLLTCATPTAPPPCDHLIVLDTGPELLAGSTRLKAASATKLALNVLTTVAFVRLGKVYSNLMVDLRASNHKLRDRAIRILIELCPELTRARAATVLDQAGGHLKTAIVMQRLATDRREAERVLAQHNGRLRAVLRT